MKKSLVEVELYEKDDKVITPDGEGVVLKDEKFNINPYKRFVLIKYFESTHQIVKNRPYKVHPQSCTILKQCYEKYSKK